MACRHLAALDRIAAEGRINRPFCQDPSGELLAKLELAHDSEQPWPEAVAGTIAAMKNGVNVIYQATFFAPSHLSRADSAYLSKWRPGLLDQVYYPGWNHL